MVAGMTAEWFIKEGRDESGLGTRLHSPVRRAIVPNLRRHADMCGSHNCHLEA